MSSRSLALKTFNLSISFSVIVHAVYFVDLIMYRSTRYQWR